MFAFSVHTKYCDEVDDISVVVAAVRVGMGGSGVTLGSSVAEGGTGVVANAHAVGTMASIAKKANFCNRFFIDGSPFYCL
jgi:hypothetical protein